MSILKSLTIKNLLLNKKRTIVTIIGIILSVALISAVSSMFFSFRGTLIEYEKKKEGDFHFGFVGVPKDDLNVFKLNKKIKDIYLVSNLGYAKLDGIQNENKPYVYVKSMTESAFNNLGITLLEGRLPENDKEIVIPKHLEENGKVKLNVGDEITLDIGKRVTSEGYVLNQNNPYNPYDYSYEDVDADTNQVIGNEVGNKSNETIIDTTKVTYKIVGVTSRPSSKLEGYTAPGYTFITYLDETKINYSVDVFVKYNNRGLINPFKTTAEILEIDPDLYYRYYFPSKGSLSPSEFEKVQNLIDNSKYKIVDNSYLITLETGISNNDTLSALLTMCIVVVIIIIFTSVFCIKNSFDISITEKIRQYGMLASIGATKKQIKKNVYFEGLVLGIIGIPLGIFCGLLASYILIIISNFLLGDFVLEGSELKFTFSIISIIFATILGLITIFLSARKSAKRASKIPPITAIRNSEDIKIKSKKLKVPKIISKLFGVGGEISYKNLKRSKKKYRTTVISIIVCSSVFIALSSFMGFAFKSVKYELKAYDYNLVIYYKYDKELNSSAKELLDLEEVKNVTIYMNNSILLKTDKYTKEYLSIHPDDIHDENLVIIILNKERFKVYAKSLNLNYEDVKDKGILKNKILEFDSKSKKNIEIDKYTLKSGDVISGPLANSTLEEFSIELAKVTKDVPFGIDGFEYQTIIFVNESYKEELMGNSNYEYVYIDSKDENKTEKNIERIFNGKDYEMNNISANAKAIQSIFILVAIFLYGFITVIALIGITNIFNTITTNMNLRRREFAMLKSIGMTKKEFSRMVRLESLFYGVKSLIIGIPIGLLLSYLIYMMTQNGNFIINYEPPYLAIILTCLVVFLLIFVIMKYSLSKINKQNTIETIRNENI